MLSDEQLRGVLETAIEKQKQNKISEAKKLYEKFFLQNPNEITCNINLANLYIKENKLHQAEELFSRTINLYPNHEVAYLNYCKYLMLSPPTTQYLCLLYFFYLLFPIKLFFNYFFDFILIRIKLIF